MEKVIILYTQFYDFNGKIEKIGGIETYIRNLIDVFESCKKEVVIIQYSNMNFKKIYKNTIVYGVKSMHKKNPKILLKKAYEISDCSKDILIFASSHMNKKNKFSKSIAIQHGIYWDIDTVKGRKFGKAFTTILKSFQIFLEIRRNSVVNKTICVDYNYINWYKALTRITNEKIHCIPNFAEVPLNYIERDGDIPSIIFARRFERIRGVENICKVVERLNKENIKFNFTFAGNGIYENQLKSKFQKAKNISFVTYNSNESVSIHSKFDIAVVPSIGSEGTSLSILEAMSAGCCVLATDVGGITNIILDGYNGFLCETDEESLYQNLKSLIENKRLRNEVSRNGYNTVIKSFNICNWKRKWEDIIND